MRRRAAAAWILSTALAAAAGCRSEEDAVVRRCAAAVADARTAWAQCRDEVKQRFSMRAEQAEREAREARARLGQIERLQACQERIGHTGPDLDPGCLAEVGLARLPTAEDARAALEESQARLRLMTAERDLALKLGDILERLPCRWEEAVEASRELPAEPACAGLAGARRATEQLVERCPGQAALLAGGCGRTGR